MRYQLSNFLVYTKADWIFVFFALWFLNLRQCPMGRHQLHRRTCIIHMKLSGTKEAWGDIYSREIYRVSIQVPINMAHFKRWPPGESKKHRSLESMWFGCQKNTHTHTHIERTRSMPNQGWIVLAPQQQMLTWILPDGQHRARCLLFQCSILDPTASNIAQDSPAFQSYNMAHVHCPAQP